MTAVIATHGAFAAFSVFCVLFLVVALALTAHWKVTKPVRSDWEREEDVCECGHGFYDHLHHQSEDPCTQLMCSCRLFRLEREETP